MHKEGKGKQSQRIIQATQLHSVTMIKNRRAVTEAKLPVQKPRMNDILTTQNTHILNTYIDFMFNIIVQPVLISIMQKFRSIVPFRFVIPLILDIPL